MLDRLKNARDRRRESDSAFALVSVVLISVVVFTAMLIVAATTLVGVTTTASAKDSLKVVNAAEGGRDDLLASLSNNFRGCQPTGDVTKDGLAYSYKIFSFRATSSETVPPRRPTDSGVVEGCPTNEDTHILLNVTGETDRGATKTVNNTYALIPANEPAPVYFGGVEGAGVVSEQNATLVDVNLLSPGDSPGTNNFPTGLDIFSNKGSISCTNATGSGVTIFAILGNVTANNCSADYSRFDGTTVAISNHRAVGEGLIARSRGAMTITNSVIPGLVATSGTIGSTPYNMTVTGSTLDDGIISASSRPPAHHFDSRRYSFR